MQILLISNLEDHCIQSKGIFFPRNNILNLTRSLFPALLQLLSCNKETLFHFTNFCVCVGQTVFEHVC